MRKNIFIAVLFLIIATISCRVDTNKGLINEFSEEIEENKEEYQQLIKAIEKFPTSNDRYTIKMHHGTKRHLLLQRYSRDYKIKKDAVFPQHFYDFFYERKIVHFNVIKDTLVEFEYLNKRNLNFQDVNFFYTWQQTNELEGFFREHGYDIYRDTIPENYGNWIFMLNNKWGIISPPKRE